VHFVALAIKASGDRRRDEYNARAILAWNIAALSRQKKLPKVDTLFVRERKRQTWQESNALMWRWYRAQEARKAAALRGA
jgi:hypothetical protein